MKNGLLDRTSAIWHRFYQWIGASAVGVAVYYCNWELRAFSSTAQSGVFGGLLTFAGLLVSILLGLMAVLTSLEQREVVQELRRGRWYKEIIGMAFEAIIVFLALAAVSLVGLLIDPGKDAAWLQKFIGIGVLFLMSLGILETVKFARNLTRILVDKPTPSDPQDTPEAARRRMSASTAEKKRDDAHVSSHFDPVLR